MVGDPPEISKNTKVIIQLNGHQMITYKPFEVEIKESIVELKFEFQKKELFDLVKLVQPGFVRKKSGDGNLLWNLFQREFNFCLWRTHINEFLLRSKCSGYASQF